MSALLKDFQIDNKKKHEIPCSMCFVFLNFQALTAKATTTVPTATGVSDQAGKPNFTN